MKYLVKILSFIGLGLSIVPAILVFQGAITSENCKNLMAVGTLLWFVTAPTWMNK